MVQCQTKSKVFVVVVVVVVTRHTVLCCAASRECLPSAPGSFGVRLGSRDSARLSHKGCGC